MHTTSSRWLEVTRNPTFDREEPSPDTDCTRRFDGASYDEIAEALQMTPATVRSTHRSAKLDLARFLEEDGGAGR